MASGLDAWHLVDQSHSRQPSNVILAVLKSTRPSHTTAVGRVAPAKPVYFPSKANDVLWCYGTKTHADHCTVALVLGEALIA